MTVGQNEFFWGTHQYNKLTNAGWEAALIKYLVIAQFQYSDDVRQIYDYHYVH